MPRSKIAGSHCGAPSAYTLAGPPERMSALGASSRTRCGRDVVPHDLAVHVLLAHAAGDELGVLRAEVENEHALGGEIVLLHRPGDYMSERIRMSGTTNRLSPAIMR